MRGLTINYMESGHINTLKSQFNEQLGQEDRVGEQGVFIVIELT